MRLAVGTKIQNRYEIRSLLGTGGMGEVYAAGDLQLGRTVAVKLLRQTDDREKIKRFRQEAKAISALNHPNILTIHEFGQFEDFHFIVSEIVNGKTLRTLINEKTLTLKDSLDIGIQIGNALAAAHHAGIIHRDIKPENIMVLADGYVKVLDFGLAKLIETDNKPPDDDSPTASLINTQAGLIVGTVNYMSPEQLRAQPIDKTVDIWGLGIVLFETIVGQRPFVGASVSDTIAAILHHPIPSILAVNRQIPSEIGTIISKMLEKETAERYQTARDCVIDLKTAQQHLNSHNSLSLMETAQLIPLEKDGKTPTIDAHKTNSFRFKNFSELVAVKSKPTWTKFLLLAVLIVVSFGGWAYFNPSAPPETVRQMKVRRLTTTGNIVNAAISPDGRFFCYVQSENGQNSLWLRQTDETSNKELIPPALGSYGGLAFSPDGNSIYYTFYGQSASATLYRVPILGGSRQEIIKDVDSPVSFSPDGGEFAFIRSITYEGVDRIIISNINGTSSRILAERKKPDFFTINNRQSLAWSPDGKTIACPFGKTSSEGEFMSVAEFDVASGHENPVTSQKWSRVGRVAWANNKSDLLITAPELGSDLYQIIKISQPDGKIQNVTREISDYFNIGLTKDGARMLATIYDKNSTISVAESSAINRTKQIGGGGYDGLGGTTWTNDGQIVFVSVESGNQDIWIMNEDGGNRRQLTFDKSVDESPTVSKDGKYIVFVSSRTGTPHIWRMNINGGELKQLTDKGGESFPQITPDSQTVIYSLRTEGRPTLWKTSIEGGESVQLTKEQTHWSAISPDGKTVACLTRDSKLDAPIKLAVVSAEDGRFLREFELTGGAASPVLTPSIRWMRDGQAISYMATKNGVSNIWLQTLTGGQPKTITDFTADKIFSFDWSADGKKIVFARGVLRNNLVLIEDF